MTKHHHSIELQLNPVWQAALTGVCTLYGFWPGISLHDSLVGNASGGYGWFPFLIYSPIAFFVTFGVLWFLLVRGFCRLENTPGRLSVCISLVFFYWVNNGTPHPVALGFIGFMAVFAFFVSKRAQEDARDREEFFNQ